jgi:CTP:molybdopterin cytidylyltransferase MocA
MVPAQPNTVVAGIVPAAGGSGRMGRPKPLLEVEGRPMLLGVLYALLEGGVAGVTVVAGRDLQPHFAQMPAGVRVALNDDPKSEMIDSVRIGLAELAASAAAAAAGYLVCPCDAAGITPADVRRCVGAFAEAPDHIVIATHAGRRGHPMILPASLVPVVCSAECDGGLNRLARNRPQLVREVPCDSPGTIANVNTPADYARLS